MRITLKIVFIFLFLSLLIIRPTPAYAWEDEDEYGHGHSYVGIHFGVWPEPYYPYDPYYYPYYDPYYHPYYYPYHADPYYYPGYTVVSSSTYQPVVVNGVTYYVSNGVYYIYTRYGYQAVATPAGVTAPVIQTVTVTATPTAASIDTSDSITINIPNNKGGYTAVLLKKSGNGFIGPQGEFYSEFPKVSQLQKMYGK